MNPYNLADDSSHFSMLMHLLHSAGADVCEARIKTGTPPLPTELSKSVNEVLSLLKEQMETQPDWATNIEDSSQKIVSLLRVSDLAKEKDREVISTMLEERVEGLRDLLDHILENGF